MDDATTITTAVKAAFAAVNFLIWTGLFLYVLRLGRKTRELEGAWKPDAARKAETR
jgi:CcmD family protein